MYIYHIGLKDICYKFVNGWDINRNAVVIAGSNKECREITSNNIGFGDEHTVNIKLWEKTKEIKYYRNKNNGIWKNSKYTFCKKIGKSLDKMKKGIVIVDHNNG